MQRYVSYMLAFEIKLNLFYIDIDECELGISRCQQQCINTEGSYRCDCRFGFQLNLDDNYTCIGNVIYVRTSNLQIKKL